MSLMQGLKHVAWIGLLPLALVIALVTHNVPLLFYTHVMSAILWTGFDVFLGIVLGPILTRLPLDARRPLLTQLFPRVFWILPISALTTATAGYFLARALGDWSASGMTGWVWAAVVLAGILTVEGFGLLLPTNYRLYRMLRSPIPPSPARQRVLQKRLQLYQISVRIQAFLQFAIIGVMAMIATH